MSHLARAWSPAEDALLRRLCEEGRTMAEIATALTRTIGSCDWRKRSLGLVQSPPLAPCQECGRPRRAANKLPLCRSCMGSAAARRRCGWPRLQVCKECGREYRHGRRGLCGRCNKVPEILARHPRIRETQLRQEHTEPTMPVLACYPDHAARGRCEHGRHDGECPMCELAQRERMGLTVAQQMEEEAA